ncbi:hypothetical protein [Haliangium sp.]|uniref:hypothetical protein n=1 Tax=Haliangium sp. TaxID=2663208 RepID=UPI003D116DE5
MIRALHFVWTALAACAVLTASVSPAHADDDYMVADWPLRLVDRPLVLGTNMFEVTGDTLQINLSKDNVGDPISLAPDLFYGVTNRLTVGVTHGRGICISGDGCNDTFYDDVTAEARFGLVHAGALALAARGGVVVGSFDPFTAGVLIGMRGRVTLGNIAVLVDPSVYVGVLERDNIGDTLDIPVQLQYQLTEQNAMFLSTGVNGPLDGFGDSVRVPVGLGALFAVSRRFDVGGEFVFTNLAGKDGGVDGRLLIVRAALRL